jgi:hypothetical protein
MTEIIAEFWLQRGRKKSTANRKRVKYAPRQRSPQAKDYSSGGGETNGEKNGIQNADGAEEFHSGTEDELEYVEDFSLHIRQEDLEEERILGMVGLGLFRADRY